MKLTAAALGLNCLRLIVSLTFGADETVRSASFSLAWAKTEQTGRSDHHSGDGRDYLFLQSISSSRFLNEC
ncbi:hypothetical protein QKW52_24160 [Bacillus sonorensis]|nr:hypothetical protein [Bacillus sonorensis]